MMSFLLYPCPHTHTTHLKLGCEKEQKSSNAAFTFASKSSALCLFSGSGVGNQLLSQGGEKGLPTEPEMS